VAPVDPRIDAATERVDDGDVVELPGGQSARVIAVPGHTASHVAYLVGDVLFCGDTLFSLGCGRLFEGTPAEMAASLARLAALPPATRVCCGHEYTLANARFARTIEPDNAVLAEHFAWATGRREAGLPTLPSTIGLELAANPFLRCGTAAVRKAVADGDAPADLDPVEVFARVRARKDCFAG
jgi:hydroxyacylglutathione hydrolase